MPIPAEVGHFNRNTHKCEKTHYEVASLDPSSWRLAALEATKLEALRRLVNQEKIPHDEKVFSLQAPHTRWFNKGKAGIPGELGLPLAIVESHEGLILDWEIMWEGTDVDVAKPLVKRCNTRYPSLHQISFDRGFWSPENYEALSMTIPTMWATDSDRSGPPIPIEVGRHSAVESRINCLERHGCSRIRTKDGKKGIARTVAASIVATNLCQIGTKLLLYERERYRRAS